jgi:hypothetical protein
VYITGVHFWAFQVLLNFGHGNMGIVKHHKIHGNLINKDVIETNIDTKYYGRCKLATSENDHEQCYNDNETKRECSHAQGNNIEKRLIF